MGYLIISCSLNPKSRSRVLARNAQNYLEDIKEKTMWIDLAQIDFPMCDGNSVYSLPMVDEMRKLVNDAEGILMACPIYNYDLSAAAKNFVELTGGTWQEKVVGFLCAAGGDNSYMSPMSFANSLMLDFRCIVIPSFVYASPRSFSENNDITPEIRERIKELVNKLVRISRALKET